MNGLIFFILSIVFYIAVVKYTEYNENKRLKDMFESANSDEQLLDILYNMYKLKEKHKRK